MNELDNNLARFAREASRAEDVAQTAAKIVAFAQHTLGTAYAGITVNQRHSRFISIGSNDPVVEQADRLQYELREGPCVQTAERTHIVLCADTAEDPRWPRLGPAAHELGLVSVLSAQLRARGRRIGALNLYGNEPRQFSGDDAAIAHVFAIHAAVALASAIEEEQLQAALDSRNQIGQAQGILMERFGFGAEQAFATLRRYSQTTNTKLQTLAQTIVATRELPAYGRGRRCTAPRPGPCAVDPR
jgi:GAF domain-containing protein